MNAEEYNYFLILNKNLPMEVEINETLANYLTGNTENALIELAGCQSLEELVRDFKGITINKLLKLFNHI